MFLTEKEKNILKASPRKQFIVTYQLGKEIVNQIVFGKACGVMPLADEVSVFCVYDENGIESFACDFGNFITVVEKSAGKLSRRKKDSKDRLQIVQP